MEESKVKAILGVLHPLISLIVINLLQIASVYNVLSYFLFTVVPLRAMAAAVRLDARLSNPFAWVLLLNLSSFWLIFCFTLLMFISCYNNIGIPLSFDLSPCPHP